MALTTDEAAVHLNRVRAELAGAGPGTDPFAAAVRATNMPIAISDPRQADNPIVFVNDAFCAMSGYDRGEIVGRNCRFLQGADTDRGTVGRIRHALDVGEPIEIDLRNYRKDGQAFWNRLLIDPVRDASGEVAFFVASQVDVTLERIRMAGLENRNADLVDELNRQLSALRDSESRLRLATEAGRLGIWEMDLRTRALTTSATVRSMFGRDPEEDFDYGHLAAAIHPDDLGRMEAAVADSVASGSDYDIEYRVRGGDRLAWVQVRGQVLRGTDGSPLRLTGTLLDVTERKAAESRNAILVRLDDEFRALDAPSDIAFAAAETLGRTLGVSRAGYGTIDAVAETITIERDWNAPGIRTIAGTLRFRDYGSYVDDLKRGDTVVCVDAYRDARTSPHADALRAISAQSFINMPVTEGDGFVALLYLNHVDARAWTPDELSLVREVAQRTRMAVQRRRAERDLRDLAGTLEAQVAARTRELMETEAALRQSQKMEAVGQLTGGLAHDFNNLLTGITGSLDLLKARVAQGRTGDVDRYVLAAQGAAKRAAALTHRLLAFSRRQTLDPRPTDANGLVAGMADLIRRTVGPQVALETVSAGGLWLTSVDPGQLENALLNLCINARDAMPDGGRIVVETANRWLDDRTAAERGLAAGQYVSLSVSDEGTGMPPDVVARAFDPFFTTKPLGQGTGLGLSMIYGFAQQSGGQARIYSEVGRGTSVVLYLPRHYGQAEQAEAAAPRAEAFRAGDSETVLVVDDEPTVRMLATEVLQDLGYRTVEAADGAAGLKALEAGGRFDLLLTDVGLPNGLNGRQVADAARVLRPNLKVLFVTGYAENAVLGHGHLDPGMHVLTKPFSVDALAAKVRSIIDGP